MVVLGDTTFDWGTIWSAHQRPKSAKFVRCWLVGFMQELAEISQDWSSSQQHWRKSPTTCGNRARTGRARPKLAEIARELARMSTPEMRCLCPSGPAGNLSAASATRFGPSPVSPTNAVSEPKVVREHARLRNRNALREKYIAHGGRARCAAFLRASWSGSTTERASHVLPRRAVAECEQRIELMCEDALWWYMSEVKGSRMKAPSIRFLWPQGCRTLFDVSRGRRSPAAR